MNLQTSQTTASRDAGLTKRATFCLAAFVAWTFCWPTMAAAQDDRSFKEFDRSMVATPAEMLEYLSARGIVAPQAVPAPAAGLAPLGDLLSQSPENMSAQQREMLKNAAQMIYKSLPENKRKSIESFVRKNGIDSEATREKLTSAGIPRQWQNELLRQLKADQKLTGEQSNADSPGQTNNPENPFGANPSLKNIEQMLKGLDSTKNIGSVDGAGSLPQMLSGLAENKKSPVTDNRFLREHLQRVDGIDWSKRLRFPRRSIGESIDSAEFSRFLERMDKPASSGLSNLLGKFQSTLSDSAKKLSLPKDRVTARFDRLLLKAAERSLNAQENALEEQLSGPVDSIFASVLDEVSKTVRNKEKPAKKNKPKQISSQTALQDSAQGASSNFPDQQATNPADEVLSALPNIAMLGADEADSLLFVNWLTIIVLAGLVIYGLVTWVVIPLLSKFGNPQKTYSRKSGSSARSAHELVSAVDEYLVSKFGSNSRWWNSKFAMQKISGLFPEFRSRIFDLFKDYERLRYAPAVTPPNDDEQTQSRATLTLLDRETAEVEPDDTLLHSMES